MAKTFPKGGDPVPLTRFIRFDMRSPTDPAFNNAMEVRVCRTIFGRLQGAIWLLFTNWKR